jgi:hypothetical protein
LGILTHATPVKSTRPYRASSALTLPPSSPPSTLHSEGRTSSPNLVLYHFSNQAPAVEVPPPAPSHPDSLGFFVHTVDPKHADPFGFLAAGIKISARRMAQSTPVKTLSHKHKSFPGYRHVLALGLYCLSLSCQGTIDRAPLTVTQSLVVDSGQRSLQRKRRRRALLPPGRFFCNIVAQHSFQSSTCTGRIGSDRI